MFECRDIGLEIVDPSLGDIREQLEDAAAGFHQLCGIRRSDRSVEFLDSATDLDGEGHLIALGTADMVYDAVPLEIETTMWVFERYVEGDVQAILDTLTWAHSAAIDPSRSPSAAPKSPANRRTVHHDKQSTAKSPADIEISKLKRRGFFKGR